MNPAPNTRSDEGRTTWPRVSNLLAHGLGVALCAGAAVAGGAAWGPTGAVVACAFAVVSTVVIALGGGGRRAEAEATLQEIESLKLEAEAAHERSRTKSRFLASMSHEIRTPMNGILGMAEVLFQSELTLEQRDCVGTLQRSAQGLMLILNDILDFSKIEAGTLELDRSPIRPVELLESVAELHFRTATEKHIEFAYFLDPAVPETMLGDVLRLRQVLTNLVTNALKFTQKGSVVIECTTVQRDGSPFFRLEVRDTGIGIAEESRSRLFQPFSQATISTAQKFGGTGLGLAISNELIGLMGGRLDVTSEIDVGSTFWLEIPLIGASSLGLPAPSLAGQRILVVDDSPNQRDVLQRTLLAWDLRVEVAADLDSAMQALVSAVGENDPFVLGIIDLDVSEGLGRELANRIKSNQALRSTKLIALNILGRTLRPGSLARAGFDAWLSNPVSPAKLRAALLHLGAETSDRTLVEAEVEQQIEAEEVMLDENLLDVLLVEDNVVNQRVATFLLQREGCRVDIAADGEQAVQAFAQGAYDLIFMDCHMPVMNGFQATRAIRATENGQTVPIIAMTAQAMPGDRERCIAEGMSDYLCKPVQSEELRRVLREWGEPIANRDREPVESNKMSQSDQDSVLDADVVASLKELGGEDDPELFAELVDLFLADTPTRLSALITAVEEGDLKAMEQAAHALKSSSANLGALRLSDLFRSIEAAGRSTELETARPLVARCRDEFEQVESALRSEL